MSVSAACGRGHNSTLAAFDKGQYFLEQSKIAQRVVIAEEPDVTVISCHTYCSEDFDMMNKEVVAVRIGESSG